MVTGTSYTHTLASFKILPEEDTVTLVFSWAWFHTAQETYIHSEDLRCYTFYFHQSSLMTKQARDNDQLFLTGEYNFKTESMIYIPSIIGSGFCI
jgi:hypothetical protein